MTAHQAVHHAATMCRVLGVCSSGKETGRKMLTLERVREVLRRYNNSYHHPSLRPLTLSEVYCLFPDTTNAGQATLEWPAIWPCAADPGVYLIFDSQMNLLYVGKASLSNTLGGRLSAHFQYAQDGSRGCAVLGTWSARPTFVMTIAVDSDKAFEAPALEEYLIAELQPPDNTRGIRKGNLSNRTG